MACADSSASNTRHRGGPLDEPRSEPDSSQVDARNDSCRFLETEAIYQAEREEEHRGSDAEARTRQHLFAVASFNHCGGRSLRLAANAAIGKPAIRALTSTSRSADIRGGVAPCSVPWRNTIYPPINVHSPGRTSRSSISVSHNSSSCPGRVGGRTGSRSTNGNVTDFVRSIRGRRGENARHSHRGDRPRRLTTAQRSHLRRTAKRRHRRPE